MKKQILTMLLVAAAGMSSYAQCEKKIILTSNSTEHLNGNEEVQKTEEEETIIEYDSKAITITPSGNTMEGTVNSTTCDWKTPFKEGKTVIKSTLNGPEGQTMNITVTIEGKDGKITVMALFDDMPDRKIRLTAAKFEEKK